jgi:hypothetical protein
MRERIFMLPYGHNSLRAVCDDRTPMVQLAPYTVYLLKRGAPDAELIVGFRYSYFVVLSQETEWRQSANTVAEIDLSPSKVIDRENACVHPRISSISEICSQNILASPGWLRLDIGGVCSSGVKCHLASSPSCSMRRKLAVV